jgi:hypothetical protein
MQSNGVNIEPSSVFNIVDLEADVMQHSHFHTVPFPIRLAGVMDRRMILTRQALPG